MPHNYPILVTGSPRSGTTWVGEMIAKSPRLHYIHEPFNSGKSACLCGIKFNNSFFYVSEANGYIYRNHINHITGSPYNIFNLHNLFKEMIKTKRLKNLKYIPLAFYSRPLIKDPISIFSSEWLAKNFNMNVIILIRHPAAVVSSYKRLNWSHPFSHFIHQPLLIQDYLHPFESEIQDYANQEQDIVDQAILLWKLIYHTVEKFRIDHTEWLFIRHEDISYDPLSGFGIIMKHINVEISDQFIKMIRKYSFADGSTHDYNPHSITRNSKNTISHWKHSLTKKEIIKIRKKVEHISSKFYSDSEW